MTAPASLESLRVLTARKVRAYTICQIGCRYVVIRHHALYDDCEEKVCTNEAEAIEYLRRKLKPIPTTRGDLVRL